VVTGIERDLIQFERAAALVVGGTSGVGLSAACKFAEAGVPRLAIVGRDPVRGDAAAARVRAAAPACDVRFIQGDANRAGDVQRIVDQVFDGFGAVDIALTATVGHAAPELLKTIALDALEGILVQQAMAPILVSRAVLPAMVAARRGVILNVASDAAKLATPGETVIGAAMAAIVMFTRALAMEAKRDGIRANVLTPSLIAGTLTHQRMQQSPFASKLFEKAGKLAMLGVVEAEDLADLAVFLASPAARRITGQAISANGGISAA
jgi:2-hydroxycyclohexanecarboxyl-CoA dehydrogenase